MSPRKRTRRTSSKRKSSTIKSRKSTTKRTRKKSSQSRKNSSQSRKNSSQNKLLSQQKNPWDRIKDLGYSNPIVYDLPWEARGLAQVIKAKNVPGIGYVSDGLSEIGKPFMVKDYTWASLCARKATSNSITPHYDGDNEETYILRKDQEEDKNTVISMFNKNAPEFLIANGTGTGKTVTTWKTIQELKPESVLIVCPAAVQAVWRQHIKDMGDKGIEIVVINYESLKKLIQPPEQAINAKKTSTQNKNIALYGKPYMNFDMIIFDEAHKLKNPTSQQSRIAYTLSNNARFVLRLTATPGKDPSQLHHLWKGLSWKTGDNIKVTDEKNFNQYINWCKKHNIGGIIPAPFGNGITWDGVDKDLKNMEKIIYHNDGKLLGIRRVPEDWDTVIRQPITVELTAEEKQYYDKVVEDTKKSILEGVSHGRKDLTKGIAAMVSLRQKTGILKSNTIVDYTKYCINDLGEQVVISTIFHNTTDTISELLDRNNIDHVIITGKNSAEEKEEYRKKFQQGKVKVIITSITTGISLHANEDSTHASSNQRRMIIADTHWSPIEHTQLEGRINRNGENGIITIPYIPETIDDKVTSRLLSGLRNQSIIQDTGDDEDLKILAKELGITL